MSTNPARDRFLMFSSPAARAGRAPLGRAWILRCPACKSHRRLEASAVVKRWQGKPDVRCDCGRSMTAKPLRGSVSPDHECGARCLGSKGHVCECSCGGANHGTNA